MTLEDRYVTPTPEGVSLDTVIAGLGSRFAAYLLDVFLQGVFLVGAVLVIGWGIGGSGQTSELVRVGIFAALTMVDFFGYFIICEMLWSGRSIGKRAAGIRVVRVGGSPVGFWSSLLRNVMRIIDMIPAPLYLVGSVLILSTSKNQRLGDILGNTMVIRERQAAVTLQHGTPFTDTGQWMAPVGAGAMWGPGYGPPPTLPPELQHWDVSGVNDQELVLVRSFLANRWGYTPEARGHLGLQLANRLWPLVAAPSVPPNPEHFLEAVVLVKSVRG